MYVADGADALLPDLAATNLGLWTIGRSPGLTSAERDLADLGWLPRALRGILEDAQGPGGSPGLAVVSRAERLVPRFPEGARDAGRLIRVLKEQRWSLATTLLFRPFGEFADLFDYVARVRPGPSGDWRETRVVVERGPGL